MKIVKVPELMPTPQYIIKVKCYHNKDNPLPTQRTTQEVLFLPGGVAYIVPLLGEGLPRRLPHFAIR